MPTGLPTSEESGPVAQSQNSPGSSPETNPGVRTRDALLIGLTLAAGVVDAVSYLGLGQIFTANMTGNLASLPWPSVSAACSRPSTPWPH